MRLPTSVLLLVTSSFLLGLAGCAADTTKSSSETSPPATVAQAEQGKDQPPSGEIQERAVLPGLPGTRPGVQIFPGTPSPGPGAVTIQSISVDPSTLPWWNTAVVKIQLTAFPPSAGFPVVVNIPNAQPNPSMAFTMPAGQQTIQFPVTFFSVATPTTFNITATDPSGRVTNSLPITILPPRVVGLRFGTGFVIGGVPPGGQTVLVSVDLDSPAPFVARGVLSYNVSYAAQGPGNYPTSGVTGPSQITFVQGNTSQVFSITVFPCHGAPCRVIVTVSGVQGILQVNP